MKIRLVDSSTSRVVETVDVLSLSFDPRDSTFCVPGGALLVRVVAVAKPVLVTLTDSWCVLLFTSAKEAIEFAVKLCAARSEAARLDENMMD